MLKAELVGLHEVILGVEGWSERQKTLIAQKSRNEFAPALERFARTNAPWSDRTGNARRGLIAQTVVSDDLISIRLWHTVTDPRTGYPYGVILEKGHSGRFAILGPTIRQVGPQIYDHLARIYG